MCALNELLALFAIGNAGIAAFSHFGEIAHIETGAESASFARQNNGTDAVIGFYPLKRKQIMLLIYLEILTLENY